MRDVIVVGAGPAGLTAGAELARDGLDVLVLDRDEAAGGVPRYTDHLGYGLREWRLLSGPGYARRLVRRAATSGAEVRDHSTVTAVAAADHGFVVDVTSPRGREAIEGRAVLLATGCRERPRPARQLPGQRPTGVYTTGWLQRATLNGTFQGRRAVILGAEHVSYSAILTLAHAGCRTAAIVTDEARHQTYAPFDLAARLRYRVPLLTRARIIDVVGHDRLEGVIVEGPAGEQALECDTLVVTGDWTAENELARRLDLPTGDRGAVVVDAFATPLEGVFAAGNVLHPARTADACARDGSQAARRIAAWLRRTA